MGSIYSRINVPQLHGSVTQIISGRKRKHEEIDSESGDEMESSIHRHLNTPVKKKLMTTPQYIYKTFFVEEQNSDISVMARLSSASKVWNLHKIYLCQSPYFASMFSGSWREREQNFIAIEIVDPKITLDSLNIVFGSLYLDEVTLDPMKVISVLAAAELLQLDGLIEKCCEVMNSTINAETAIKYYEAANQYAAMDVKKNAFQWLLINLLSFYSKHTKWLMMLNADLLTELLDSPDLVVMQTEFALYALLKVWMYLEIHETDDNVESTNSTNNNASELISQASNYFSNLKSKAPFLHTRSGQRFVKPFRKLRLQHLINHPVDIKLILEDNIIPKDWLYLPFMVQWNSLIKIDNGLDSGPVDCDETTFYQTCLRCGRVLDDDGYQKWRWTGFNFGVDLVLVSDTRTLSIKRHHRNDNERLLSLQSKRNILLRVTIFSLNEQRQVRHLQTTNIKSIQLDRNEETRLIYLDSELVYPVLISLNLLVSTPNKIELPQEQISSLPSTSGQSAQIAENSNSNESEISTIGTTNASKLNNSSLDDDS
ncbi:protein germ cell-less [Sitodiplosis mosellana]|uniref:protein germ cell-less n=1 Tax=Sitodiplosis mosellana TaxID=263140 RepID=UPI0024437747|nr:protein germ cell-less [Sitodiplosis mosellana]XP_055314230.1 protein germ cell-less [Sitodiplosis mosellana]XP_055314231.1 protein germ cell-less [Sitodiplosis mosellana]XP_055314232.1 protein germ cell-less [Sitodiplosis mosellana]XP_055314233.1 protein germ cell-less [Sitodiplosis mosellana]XP_055314234.1 protein germ cell-less [Sitodiplosis mosellana]